jgi:spore germination protein
MEIYIVQPGDTINSIADRYGVSASTLIQDNAINPNTLVPGQTIVIAFPKQTYTVEEGDTLDSIATTHDIPVMQLLRNNPFLSSRENIYPGETLVISYNTHGKTTTIGFSYPFIDETTLRKTLPNLTYISVFNYRATKEGNITTYFDDENLVKLSLEYGVVPLIMLTTLSDQGEPDLEVAYELLLNVEYQDIQLNNLINIMRTKGYYGVNFVFYFMNESNQWLYQNFITKASDRLHQEGYYVYTTINPNIENVDNKVEFEKIDYSKINEVVDDIIFLQFIWGMNTNPPAPVSSIYNLKTFIDYVITLVPPDNLLIGKPVISYDWTLPYVPGKSSAYSLTTASAVRLAYDVGSTIQFDEISQTPYFEYYQFNVGFPIQHIVWSIDARSIDALVKLITEYGLRGTGIWSIMVYVPQLWLILNSQFDIEKILPVI